MMLTVPFSAADESVQVSFALPEPRASTGAPKKPVPAEAKPAAVEAKPAEVPAPQ
jgi:hypothetical protein